MPVVTRYSGNSTDNNKTADALHQEMFELLGMYATYYEPNQWSDHKLLEMYPKLVALHAKCTLLGHKHVTNYYMRRMFLAMQERGLLDET